jgi:hypothetical protein
LLGKKTAECFCPASPYLLLASSEKLMEFHWQDERKQPISMLKMVA